MDEHKHHDIVPAGTERTEKQKQLSVTLHKSQQRIDQRVKKWQDLRQAVESLKHSAQTVLEENERIFTELLLSIERKYIEVKEMIRTHERTTVTQAETLLDRLEEEITLLKKKHNDLELLSHTDDHIHFLQAGQLILDVNTVHPNLHLSEGNRAATMKNEPKNYPDHPDRFDH
uniref:SPRY-associated domain-containing protein n=2 Tax=Haplochromini TaxID=319058 RepID=A0A3Q2X5C5_HAPBU